MVEHMLANERITTTNNIPLLKTVFIKHLNFSVEFSFIFVVVVSEQDFLKLLAIHVHYVIIFQLGDSLTEVVTQTIYHLLLAVPSD